MASFRFARKQSCKPRRCVIWIDKEIFPARMSRGCSCRRPLQTHRKDRHYPVGTCKMGRDGDPEAVLDASLNVYVNTRPAA